MLDYNQIQTKFSTWDCKKSFLPKFRDTLFKAKDYILRANINILFPILLLFASVLPVTTKTSPQNRITVSPLLPQGSYTFLILSYICTETESVSISSENDSNRNIKVFCVDNLIILGTWSFLCSWFLRNANDNQDERNVMDIKLAKSTFCIDESRICLDFIPFFAVQSQHVCFRCTWIQLIDFI